MLLQFTVRGQQIFRVDKTPLASDSRLYIAGAVDFDGEWDDITAFWLNFEPRQGEAINAYLTGGAFDESLGVSLSAGTWRVSAHGTNTAGKEIHTTPLLINVAQAGGRDGEAPPYVPPDAAGQIAAVAAEARDTANRAMGLAEQSGENAEIAKAAAKAAAGSAQTAVAAATAAQKSAEEAAESAKEAAAGGGVQSDYAQNDPTAKDYIKNRPGGYEEGWAITWDGDTTGKVFAEVMSGYYVYKVSDKILTADQISGGQMTTTVTGGETQSNTITSDMVEESEDAIFVNSFPMIVKNPGEFVVMNGAFTITIPESGVYFLYVSMDGLIMYTSSISNISPHPFEDKYIPNTIYRKNEVYAKNEVYNKDEVYAKKEVYAKDEAYTRGSQIISITWDGNTDGKDTLKFNGWSYYKMSDIVPDYERVQSVATTSSYDSATKTKLYEGENCYYAGSSIVVTKAGTCKLAVNEGGTKASFTAPSAGIYFWSDFNTNRYQTGLELSFQGEQGGVIVKSLTKKWAITVDDSGNISATEITEQEVNNA